MELTISQKVDLRKTIATRMSEAVATGGLYNLPLIVIEVFDEFLAEQEKAEQLRPNPTKGKAKINEPPKWPESKPNWWKLGNDAAYAMRNFQKVFLEEMSKAAKK